MKKKYQPAAFRLHAMLDVRSFTWLDSHADQNPALLSRIWGNTYQSLLPCHVKVFATNDINEPLENWDMMVEYKEQPDTEPGYRWADRSAQNGSAAYTIKNMVELNAADELYMPLNFSSLRESGQELEYRYYRIEIYDTFHSHNAGTLTDTNAGAKYVTFNELEIFVKE